MRLHDPDLAVLALGAAGSTLDDRLGEVEVREAVGPVVVITLAVADIDATKATIEKLGGNHRAGKQPVGDMGFAAYFTDSEGNVIALWQSAT